MNCYIAGKITGNTNYKKKFMIAQDYLQLKEFIVINPANANISEAVGYTNIMHICYAMIDICEIVYFLKDWKNSRGANLEYEYAVNNGKCLMFEDDNYIADNYKITKCGMVIKRKKV
jgi:hypothetical protein